MIRFFDKSSTTKQCQKLSTIQFRSTYAFLEFVSIESLTMLGKQGTLEAFGFKSVVPNKKSRPNDNTITDEEDSGADESQVFQKPVAKKKILKQVAD